MESQYDAAKLAAKVIIRRRITKRQGMREAANEAGVSPAQICKAENQRRVGKKSFIKICQWLGVEPEKIK